MTHKINYKIRIWSLKITLIITLLWNVYFEFNLQSSQPADGNIKISDVYFSSIFPCVSADISKQFSLNRPRGRFSLVVAMSVCIGGCMYVCPLLWNLFCNHSQKCLGVKYKLGEVVEVWEVWEVWEVEEVGEVGEVGAVFNCFHLFLSVFNHFPMF